MSDNPYVGAGHRGLLVHYLPNADQRALLVQQTADLLADDDAHLAASAAAAMRHVIFSLTDPAALTVHVSRLRDLLAVAEAIVALALDLRTEGLPKRAPCPPVPTTH